MSRLTTRPRALALAATTAALLAAAASPASAAQSSTLDLQCRFPVGGVQPVHMAIDVDAPASRIWNGSTNTGAAATIATAVPGLPAAATGAPTGAARLQVGLEFGSSSRPLQVDGSRPELAASTTIDKATTSSDSPAVATDGPVPLSINIGLSAVAARTYGTADSVLLRERAFDATGAELALPTVTSDVDGAPISLSPGVVPCKKIGAAGDLWVVKGSTFYAPFSGASGLVARGLTPTSAVLTWDESTSWLPGGWEPGVPEAVVTADTVERDELHSVTLPWGTTTTTFTGLTPGRTYRVEIYGHQPENGRDVAQLFRGTTSWNFTTPVTPPQPTSWDLAGTLSLAKGSGALKGALTGLDVASSSGSGGALSFAPSVVRLNFLGLPIVAAVQLVPVGPATSASTVGGVTIKQDLRVKVIQARLLGSFALVNGSACQSAVASVALTGAVAQGGTTLSGPLNVSGITGCGQWTSIVSNVFSGQGKVTAKLAPAVSVPTA